MLPSVSEFDISTAITQRTCGSSIATNAAYNQTPHWDCSTTPPPVASSTSVLSVDAFTPASQTTGNGTHVPNLATVPPLAVATLPSAAGTFTEGTPFVYFSEYEIESSKPTTFRNGSEGCATATQTFKLNRLFSFEFDGDESELSQQRLASEDTTGEVDSAFLRAVGETDSVTAGSWTAEPTVLVVVERGVVAQAVLAFTVAMTGERSGSALITPTPTLPTYLTPVKPTAPPPPPTTATPRVEQTADSLNVPVVSVKKFSRVQVFVAHIEHSATTLTLPQPTDANVITTNIGGKTLIATALSNMIGDGSNGGNSNGGNSNSQGGSGNQNGGSQSNNGNGGNLNSQGGSGSQNGNSQSNNENGGGSNPQGGSAQDGDERDWIMVPFVARVEDSAITLNVPAPATQKVATIGFEGKTLTGTALSALQTGADGGQNQGSSNGGSNNAGSGSQNAGGQNGGSENGGSQNGGDQNGGGNGAGANNANGDKGDGQNAGGDGVFGALVSKIANAAKPSNAAQVLSQAMANGHSDTTAAAIAAGIGAFAAGAGYGSSGGQSGSGSGSNVAGGGSERLGASPGQVIDVGGASITASPAQAFVVDGQTAYPGGQPITVDGTRISFPASTNAVIVDGSTVPLAGGFASSTQFNINGMDITAQPGVGFPIDGQTLLPGGPAITVDGTRLSLGPGGDALVIGSSTSRLANAQAAGAASEVPQLTIGSQVFTANAATQFFFAPGQTLTPGGSVVFSGTTVSLDSDASAFVVNGETRTFGSSPDATITSQPDIIRVNGQAFAPNAGGSYLISGETLTPGGSITVSGPNGVETLSLSPSGSELVAIVSGHTITSTLDSSAASDITAAPVLTIGGQTFNALPGTDGANPTYLVNGETLTAGEEETVTVSGRTFVVSLAPEATLLEVEELGSNGQATRTRLETLFPATQTGSTSTMSGSGSRSTDGSGSDSPSETGGSSPAQETGAASAVQATSFLLAASTLMLAILL